MRKTTLLALKTELSKKPKIIFDYRNQTDEFQNNHFKPVLEFDKMIVMTSPNRICLTGAAGNLSFDHIKELFLEKKSRVGYTNVYIICSDFFDSGSVKKYILNLKTGFSKEKNV